MLMLIKVFTSILFHEGSAGKALFEGFMRRHPHLTERSPQPLSYVGVFKPFKTTFNKSCTNYVRQYPGCVITTDVLALMVAQASQASFTPIHVLYGFKKAGIYPFNHSEIDD